MLGLTRKSKLVKAQNEIEELNKTIAALTEEIELIKKEKEEIVGKIEIAEKAAKDKQEELNKQIEVSLKLQDQIKKVEAEKAPAVKKPATRKRTTTTSAKKKTTTSTATKKKTTTTAAKRKTATKKKAEEADK
jgi:hypothetical protein